MATTIVRIPIVLLALLFCLELYAADASPAPSGLRVEYSVNPLGIDATRPRLSWRNESSQRGARQSAYQIQAASTPADLEQGKLLWDSGRVRSDQSLFVTYGGPELRSGERVAWRVRVWDAAQQASAWSALSSWEMGLLQPADWQADWVTVAGPADTARERPVAMFRDRFVVDRAVTRARLYATARGVYQLELNGQRVGNEVLAPGWTDYKQRIQYQTYDVTGMFREGENVLGAFLADGWYRGYLGGNNRRNQYGDRTALRLQLQLTFADGSETVFGTDAGWRASTAGPYRMGDIYNGETYDARREMPGWSSPGFDDTGWQPVAMFDGSPVALVAPQGPPIRRMQEIRPVSISKAPNGDTLVDMGQNMVGWIRLKVAGPAGTELVMRHGEVLDQEGNLYTENLRTAAQVDTYTLAGKAAETYEPQFTFHGFRYVAISGYPGELTEDAVTGVVVYSDLQTTGSWDSSNPLLNQLYSNILWSQKGNFVGVPTDCPQRDERLGWTGDAQVFAPTAAFNMNVSGFFAKWLADLALDQLDNGNVPHVIPHVLKPQHTGAAGWGDAATIVPWVMYRAYGDRGLLQAQYPSMKAWVDYVSGQAEDDIWRSGNQLGDWLAPVLQARSDNLYKANTGNDLVATAYFAHSADLVSRAAGVLGNSRDARRYSELAGRVRKAFQREFVTDSGRLAYATQTAYVLALAFDLLPQQLRQLAADRLAADVQAHGNHLTTGFLGTPELTRVLSNYGHTDTAYRLLTQTDYPSWLYPVTFGATTIWERWDALRPDGTFQNPRMTSFNHYAYGAVGQWMVEVVAGLQAGRGKPGYKEVLIGPRPGGGLSRASASLDTPYGKAASSWRFDGADFLLEATVPPNTAGLVVLPGAAGLAVLESGIALREAVGVDSVDTVNGDLQLSVGAGSYEFTYHAPDLALAARYRELTPDSTLADIISVPAGRAAVEELAPMLLSEHFPRAFTMRPIGELPSVHPDMRVVEKIIDQLDEINARQREAILQPASEAR